MKITVFSIRKDSVATSHTVTRVINHSVRHGRQQGLAWKVHTELRWHFLSLIHGLILLGTSSELNSPYILKCTSLMFHRPYNHIPCGHWWWVGIHPMLLYCWARVVDSGPTIQQHWVFAGCVLIVISVCLYWSVLWSAFSLAPCDGFSPHADNSCSCLVRLLFRWAYLLCCDMPWNHSSVGSQKGSIWFPCH